MKKEDLLAIKSFVRNNDIVSMKKYNFDLNTKYIDFGPWFDDSDEKGYFTDT